MINKDYIADFGKTTDVNSVIERSISGGNMILMFTDRFECCSQKEIEDTAHLLEARVFTEQLEIKVMRPTIADEFSWRVIDDKTVSSEDYIVEDQYLSIERASGNDYYAIGGGKYTLPIQNAEKIRIHNYISYDEQGIAQVTDFRAVKYLEKGEE